MVERLYDSLHLNTVYRTADNITRVQFPTLCALIVILAKISFE